jgi:hypothetical protein
VERIEIITPEPEKARPVLQEEIERQRQLLSHSVARTEEPGATGGLPPV